MKPILSYIFFTLIVLSTFAQESITMKFYISNKGGNPIEKVQLKVLGQSYTVKSDSPLLVKVIPNYNSPLEISCKASSVEEVSYFFIPSAAQNYEFELSNSGGLLSIVLINSESVKLGLLDGINETAIAENQKKQEGFKTNPNNLSLGYSSEKEGATNPVRDEWLRRGGEITYLSVGAMATYFRMDMDGYGTMNGFGGGASAAVNKINLTIPEYKPGTSKWSSLNYGVGMDLQVYGSTFSMEVSGIKSDMKISNLEMQITGNLGWTWGFGKFVDEATWKGIAITAKYRPSIRITSTATETTMVVMGDEQTISSSDGSTKFNAGGFGFDLDFNSFSAKMDKLAPKPNSKISFFFLPPIGKNPLFFSFSYGLTFYTK